MKLTVKAALLREREQMRKRRYMEEFRTIYNDNCEYHQPVFWRCSYKETEQIDMKQWRLIYSHGDKENLWRGIYRRELIRHDETISAGDLKSDDPAWVEAVTCATKTVMQREKEAAANA